MGQRRNGRGDMRKWSGAKILVRNKGNEKNILFAACPQCSLRFIASLSKGQKPYTIQFDGSENSRNHNDRTLTFIACFERSRSRDKNLRKSAIYIYIYFYFIFSRTRRHR